MRKYYKIGPYDKIPTKSKGVRRRQKVGVTPRLTSA